MKPTIAKGAKHTDDRGSLFYNNNFDATAVKRIYIIENINTESLRAWQGHKIAQRWFSALTGSFEIQLIAVDNWEKPSKNLEKMCFPIDANSMDVLHVPAGHIISIQALEEGAKLLVMANDALGELKDESRYEANYFE